jgi:hypothetical protein
MPHQHFAVELELLNPLAALQVRPAVPLRELLFPIRLLRHLEEEQVGQLGNVLVVGDAVGAQDVAEGPELLYDVAGVGHARFDVWGSDQGAGKVAAPPG